MAVFVVALPLSAAQLYYVAVSGSGTNPGTQTKP